MTVDTIVSADVRADGALVLLLDARKEGDKTPPSEFRLLNDGHTFTTKGVINCDANAAASVVAAMQRAGRDSLPFDYGHGMLSPVQSYDTARAAGWFTPEARGGELWAVNIQWTPKAKQAFEDREFRYFSPALMLNADTRMVSELINIALTNIPATLNIEPLVADSRVNNMDIKTILGAFSAQTAEEAVEKFNTLTSDNEKLVAAAKEMQVSLSSVQVELSSVKTELADFKAAAAKAEKDSLIEALSKDGKLAPALKTWALSQSIEQLQAFSAVAPVISGAGKVESKDSPSAPSTLTDEQKKLCFSLGVSEKSFLKGLEVQSKQEIPFIKFNPITHEESK